MAAPSNFRQLLKTDRRKQWKLLKDKHAKAITKAKVNFDEKLGPALDKYQTQVDKLTRLSATAELTSTAVDPVFQASRTLKPIVDSYQGKVKLLDDPARKELAALLTAIDNDCISWAKLAVNTMGSVPTGTTDAQKNAARAVDNPLVQVRAMALTLVTRGERAQVAYMKDPPRPRPNAARLAGHVTEAARLAGPAAFETLNAARQVVAGSNYPLFKTRAEAAIHLIQQLRTALNEFEAKWDINLDSAVMTNTSNVDAAALHGNYDQAMQYVNDALTKLARLP
jgi:hypothetical protein